MSSWSRASGLFTDAWPSRGTLGFWRVGFAATASGTPLLNCYKRLQDFFRTCVLQLVKLHLAARTTAFDIQPVYQQLDSFVNGLWSGNNQGIAVCVDR